MAKVRAGLDAIAIRHVDNPCHILPVGVGDPVPCRHVSDIRLDRHWICIQPIIHPAVPKGTERLRITPSPVPSDGDVDRLVDALSELWSQCRRARRPLAAQ